jgi:hypothetical protein
VGRALIFSWAIAVAISQPAVAQEADAAGRPETASSPAPQNPPTAEPPIRPNYFVPLFDIVAFDFLVNRIGYAFVDRRTYAVDISSVRRNLKGPWVLDNDPFSINQFMHPYQGSMYHGFARSAALNYWESLGYTSAGSLLWEIAGETTLPSGNDQITTGIGGSFLGEPLFRLANLVLARSDRLPRFWRELSAAVISPSTGFNRLAYGERFQNLYPDRDPSFFARAQFGAMGTASVRKSLAQSLARNEAVADFSVEYGSPGGTGYSHRRPFDYFSFQFSASTASRFENIFSRGLLAGKDYGAGTAPYRGVWGLYGTYDYVFPQLFRVSSTALSLGTTWQRRLAGSSAIQSTVLTGLGFGAAGAIRGGQRSYRYGLAPQVLVAARFIAGDTAAFDLALRDYHVSRIASSRPRGSDNIARADAQFTLRFHRQHAATVKYVWSRRAAADPEAPDGDIQSRGSIGLFYTYLGGPRFGAVTF